MVVQHDDNLSLILFSSQSFRSGIHSTDIAQIVAVARKVLGKESADAVKQLVLV